MLPFKYVKFSELYMKYSSNTWTFKVEKKIEDKVKDYQNP